VQVWVNGDSDANIVKIAHALDQSTEAAKPKLFKSFILYVIPKSADSAKVKEHLEKLATDNNFKDVALLYIRDTDGALDDYKINKSPDVKNTVLVYVKHRINANFVNLDGEKEVDTLKSAVAEIVK